MKRRCAFMMALTLVACGQRGEDRPAGSGATIVEPGVKGMAASPQLRSTASRPNASRRWAPS